MLCARPVNSGVRRTTFVMTGADMSVEQNKAIVSRFYEELWNNRNLSLADEIISPYCVTHQLQSGAVSDGVLRGPEAVKHHISEWLGGFPDLHFDIEQMVAEDDRVASQSIMRGTHTGTWLGIAPTNKEVSIRLMVTQRIENGKIAEDWVLVEALGFFQQLGLLPATQEIIAKVVQ
jgi:predicted ester cyclase